MLPRISSLCEMCLFTSHCVCLPATFNHLKTVQSWPSQKPSFSLMAQNNNSGSSMLGPHPIKRSRPVVIIRDINFKRSPYNPLLPSSPSVFLQSLYIPLRTFIVTTVMLKANLYRTWHICKNNLLTPIFLRISPDFFFSILDYPQCQRLCIVLIMKNWHSHPSFLLHNIRPYICYHATIRAHSCCKSHH